MKRSQYWSADQNARWAIAERRAGCKLPRTHENCMTIFGRMTKSADGRKVWVPGPARPGKTASDRANKAKRE